MNSHQKFQVKANLPNGETCRFSFTPDLSWEDFKTHLMEISNLNDICVFYSDEEGDKVTLTADDEFQDVKRSLEIGSLINLRVIISANPNARPYKKDYPTPIPRNYSSSTEKKHYTDIAMEIGEEFRLHAQANRKYAKSQPESHTTKTTPKDSPPEWLHPFVETASEAIAMRVLDELKKSDTESKTFSSLNNDNSLFNTFNNTVMHTGIVCRSCEGPIIGNRYKCGNCVSYDICEHCLVKPNIHDETHVFLILRQSCPNAGFYNGHYQPILKHNLYLPTKKDIAKKHDSILDFSESTQDQSLEKTKKKLKKESKLMKKMAKQTLPKHIQTKVELYKEKILNKRQEIKEIREKIQNTRNQHFSESELSSTTLQMESPLFSNPPNTMSTSCTDYNVLILRSSCEPRIVAPNDQFECKWIVRNNGKLHWTDVVFLCTGGTLPIMKESTQLLKCSPDSNLEITLNFQAPPHEGLYNSIWSLSQHGNTFGPIFKTDVRVISDIHMSDKNVDVDSGAEDDVDLTCVDQGYALRAFSGINSSQQPLIATSREDDIIDMTNYNTLIDHDSIELYAADNASDIQRPPSSLFSDTENIYNDPTPCMEVPTPPTYNHQRSDSSLSSSDDSFIVVDMAECFTESKELPQNSDTNDIIASSSSIPSAPPLPAPLPEITNGTAEIESRLFHSPMTSPVPILNEQLNDSPSNPQIEVLTASIRSLSSEMSDTRDNLEISQINEPLIEESFLLNFDSQNRNLFQSTITESTILQEQQSPNLPDKPTTSFEFNPIPPPDTILTTPFQLDPVFATPTAPSSDLMLTPPTEPEVFNDLPQSSVSDVPEFFTSSYYGDEQAFDLPHTHWKPKLPETPLEQLMIMGFCNRRLNLELLDKYKNNLSEVVAELIDQQNRAWPVNNI